MRAIRMRRESKNRENKGQQEKKEGGTIMAAALEKRRM
jgi:hypothetical protein